MARRPRFSSALRRPRLLTACRAPCVVLTAPAGGGKTVLAAQLADAVPDGTRAVWLRPPAPGTTAGALVTQARLQCAADPPAPAADPAVLAESLLEALAGQPFLLVLDDADRADPAELARWLAETVPLLDAGSSVVVCARDRPAGLVGRLGTATQLVDAATLAFTVDEIGGLLGPEHARAVHAATGGWPAAVAVAAAQGVGTGAAVPPALTEALHAVLADDPGCRAALDVLALAPAVPAAAFARLGWPDAPARLVERTPLVQREGELVRLAEPAQSAWLAAGASATPATRVALADALADDDPATAVDLLLDAGRPERATEVLAGAVGRLPVSWVRPRLYRLPAALRRSLPPALSAVAATVDLGSAIAYAERALGQAGTSHEQAAARFALGSALAHSGELEAAAGELAAARRLASHPELARSVDSWLGLVRLWLGDLSGAEAAAGAARRGSALANWVLGECALERGDLAAARAAGERAGTGTDLGPSVGQALRVRVALWEAGRAVPGSPAATLAQRAYHDAVSRGGLELLAAAGVHAWFLLAAGRVDEAAAVADTLRRVVGRQDAASRLQAALIRLSVARSRADAAGAERAGAEVSALRRQGFALLEAQARRFAPGLAGAARELRVRLVGEVAIELPDRTLSTERWRSRKAREALLALAAAGPGGIRRDELVEALWPGREPGRGRTLLRTALAEVRRVLEPDRPPGEPSAYLHADRERVRVVARVDLLDARAHAAAGRLDAALSLLGGEVAAGEPDLGALARARAEA
ncbi:AAA family ATPase, partial [Actinophytocola sp.]|uniref:AAA family ATPase n=1 Tax=Actinophytocola sp. TaxID=1872138 RepID=UPI003D6C2F23